MHWSAPTQTGSQDFYHSHQSASIIVIYQVSLALTVSYLCFQRQATVEEDERDGNVRDGDLWL